MLTPSPAAACRLSRAANFGNDYVNLELTASSCRPGMHVHHLQVRRPFPWESRTGTHHAQDAAECVDCGAYIPLLRHTHFHVMEKSWLLKLHTCRRPERVEVAASLVSEAGQRLTICGKKSHLYKCFKNSLQRSISNAGTTHANTAGICR